MLSTIARISLAFLPTPLHELPRLTGLLQSPTLVIKRDDQTGLALGGNKTRKLEYLLGDALSQHCDTIVTAGAKQSNHCRQTSAAAARLGLRCELLLQGDKPNTPEGNLLLDLLFGAVVHWKDDKNTPQSLDELADTVRLHGYNPYIIPYGGSNALGALGYINAMLELADQQKNLLRPITHIIVPSCSGATQVGLVIGARLTGFTGKIIGISVDYDITNKEYYQKLHVDLAYATCAKIGVNMAFTCDDFTICYDYAQGYGMVHDSERNAIQLMAQYEGILLDPVYTGRAFGALLNMINKNIFAPTDTILFWHTGGTPALFPYADSLMTTI